MERRVKRAKAHILMNKAGVQTSGVEYKDPAVRGVWGDEGNVGGNGRGHSAEYSASARGEDGGCGQAVRGCRQSEAVSAPEPGWGAAGAVLIPRPGFGDDHMLSHVAPEKAGKWPLGGLEEGQETRGTPRPRPSPACLLLPESPSSAAASDPGRSVRPVKAGACSGPVTCLSGGPESQGLVGLQDTGASAVLSQGLGSEPSHPHCPGKLLCPGLLPPSHSPWWSPRGT